MCPNRRNSTVLELPDSADVEAASERVSQWVLNTPLLGGRSLNALVDCDLHFKCENLQRTGSFKFRGATNTLLQLLESGPCAGVATHSSGNHGAALALAAREFNVPAHVVIPENATAVKRQAIEIYGAQVVSCGETLAEREAALAEVVARTGAEFVPPYNDARVIAGQGTAALEMIHAQPELDEVWVPVGGGGLASGTLLALRHRGVSVFGVEPALADDARDSLKKGEIQPQLPPRTIADGLRTALGPITFEILRGFELPICTVSEQAIIAAQRLLWNRLKLVVEPSGAVAFAGLLSCAEAEPQRFRNRRIGVLISGGNCAFPG